MVILGRLSTLPGLLFATVALADTTSQNLAINVTATGAPIPVVIQEVISTNNPANGAGGEAGNNFVMHWPNPLQAGDALVCGISYPDGNTPSLSDDINGSWPALVAAQTADSAGNEAASVFVLPNTAAGSVSKPGTMTFSFGAAIQPFQYTCMEVNNIVSASPVDGTSHAAAESPSSGVINPGDFTPSTNNDASGGHWIWHYTSTSPSVPGGYPTSWEAGANFTLLDANIVGAAQMMATASQAYLQATNGLVTPAITETGDNGDQYNTVAVALKVAAGGGSLPSGIHVNKIFHFTQTTQGGSSVSFQAPVTGNLRVFAANMNGTVSGISDNDAGSSWTLNPKTQQPGTQISWSPNRGPLSTYKVIFTLSSINRPWSFQFFDIGGAAASPYDAAAGVQSNIPTTCPPPIANTSAAPSITPRTNGLTIAGMPMGQGPVSGVVAPVNAIFDYVFYPGQADGSLFDNSDALGHFYNPDLSTENWSWTLNTNSGANCTGTMAVHFNHG